MNRYSLTSPRRRGWPRPAILAAVLTAITLTTRLPNCAAAGTPSGRPPATVRECLLGAPLADAQKTDLFTFFHLEQTGSEKDADGRTVTSFKPSGPTFRPLVTLKAVTDDAGRLAGLDLILAREFIDSRTNGIFARDIAKSLLRSALPGTDQKAVSTLINEIEFPRNQDRPVLVGPGYRAPSLPSLPSLGYQAYLGKQERFAQVLPGGELRMENGDFAGAKWLVIALR